jgi:heme oxygenase
MNLKEATAEKHREAESLPFIKSMFEANVDKDQYADYLFQLGLIYYFLEEGLGEKFKLFEGMEGLKRHKYIIEDFNEIASKDISYIAKESTLEYFNYLSTIGDAKKAMAHVYVRHMGDLFGGQQLAKCVPGSAKMYSFDNIRELMTSIRSKLSDDMADEANIAFDHNIKMLKEYS